MASAVASEIQSPDAAASAPHASAVDAVLAHALDAWQKLNLPHLQRELDAQGLAVIENQNQASAARKRLAEQTKDFRKASDDDKLREVKNLVKAYQTEIDANSKRSKFAETSFLSVYKLLLDLPDPASLLASSIDQIRRSADAAAAQAESRRLRDELAAANAQLSAARLAESNTASLKQRLAKYEAMLNDMVAEKVAQKEQEMKLAMDEKIRIYKETEYSLTRQLGLLRDQLSSLRNTNEVAQAKLADESLKLDDSATARLAELDIVYMELERANNLVAHLERENSTIKSQLADVMGAAGRDDETGPHSSPANVAADLARMSDRVALLESQKSSLSDQLEQVLESHRSSDMMRNKQVADMERELAKKSFETAELQAAVDRCSDYEEIKKELEIIKGIEFDGFVDLGFPEVDLDKQGSSDAAAGSTTGQGGSNTQSLQSHPLERLLMAKNKRLQTDVTSLKIELAETRSSLEECIRTRDDALTRIEKNHELIAKLEGDLLRMNDSWATTQNKKGSMSEGLESLMADSRACTEAVVPRTSSTFAPGQQQDLSSTSLSAAASATSPQRHSVDHHYHNKSSADASIIPILTSQRDRYRQRFEEAERQSREHNQTISDLRYELANLKSDNVKLYEKLRYAESYYGGWSGSVGIAVDGGMHARSGSTAGRDTNNNYGVDQVSNKYRGLYEDTLDPFRRFHQQEEQRRYRTMNPAERATLSLTRILSRNKYSRFFFIIYSAVLHILVFVMLYELSMCSSEHAAAAFPQSNTLGRVRNSPTPTMMSGPMA